MYQTYNVFVSRSKNPVALWRFVDIKSRPHQQRTMQLIYCKCTLVCTLTIAKHYHTILNYFKGTHVEILSIYTHTTHTTHTHTHTHTQGERENICQIYTINTNTHQEGQAFSTWVLKKKSKCTTCFEHMLIGSCRFMWLQLYTWYIKKNVYKMQLIFVVLQSCIIIWVRFIRS